MRFVLAAALVSLSIVPATASPWPTMQGFYIGTDWEHQWVNWKGATNKFALNNSLDGAGIQGGYRFNKFFSVEAQYGYTRNNKAGFIGPYAFGTEVLAQSATIDAYAYLPIRHTLLDVFATGGIGAEFGHSGGAVADIISFDDETKFTARGGIGSEFWCTDSLALRLTARYVWAHFEGTDGGPQVSLGFIYKF